MQYVTIEIIDTVGLNQREKRMLQNTVLNFAAMSNAIIFNEDLVINPLGDGNNNIGVVMVYAKPLEEERGEELKKSLSNRFSVYFKMSDLDLKAQIKMH